MTSFLFSKDSLGLWAFGLIASFVALSLTELSAWMTYAARGLSWDLTLAAAGAGAILWAASLAFAEGPRRWLLENIELSIMAAVGLTVFPFAIFLFAELVLDMGSLAWTSFWLALIINGSFALSLAGGLIWGQTQDKLAIITSLCLTATTLANELIGASSALAFAIALAASACLIASLGKLAESSEATRFTLWRHPLRKRRRAFSTAKLAWALVLMLATLLALEFGFVMMLVTPAMLACALYLYDGEDHVKLIGLGLVMMAFSAMLGFEAIGLDAYLIAGLGLALMLVCTECGPALVCCAIGCLLMGMCAPQLLGIELGRALYDPALFALCTSCLAALAALCYSRPDSMLISSFEVQLPDLLFLEEDFEWDEDFEYEAIDPRKESERV